MKPFWFRFFFCSSWLFGLFTKTISVTVMVIKIIFTWLIYLFRDMRRIVFAIRCLCLHCSGDPLLLFTSHVFLLFFFVSFFSVRMYLHGYFAHGHGKIEWLSWRRRKTNLNFYSFQTYRNSLFRINGNLEIFGFY